MRRIIPPVTKYLLIINCVAFLLTIFAGGVTIPGTRETSYVLNEQLGLHFFLADDFKIFQLFTYMFMHGGYAHIFFNMFALWMFGSIIEQAWGSRKYLIFYLVCGLGAGICQEVAQFFEYYMIGLQQYPNMGLLDMFSANIGNSGVTVGASGAIYGLLLAFAMTFPEERLFIIPIPFPIKAKWYVIGLMVLDLLSALGTSSDGVAHLAHLGGMLFGYLMIRYWRKGTYNYNNHFGASQEKGFFGRMRDNWDSSQVTKKWHTTRTYTNRSASNESDWEYNARKKQDQDEIDRILDKIRKSGYDSLSKDEKLKLFDQSNKK